MVRTVAAFLSSSRVVVLILASLVAMPLVAQDEPQVLMSEPDINPSGLPVMRSNVNMVLVPVTVTDIMSHPVMGLSSGDFQVFEDKRPQHIQYFAQEDAPISVGLVLDYSGSMQSKKEMLFQSIEQFFANANPEDDYYVVTVSQNPKVIASGTQSVHDIENALAQETPFGWTALLDAVDLTIREMKHSRYSRRAIVIISDGGDNDSRLTPKRLIKEVEESNSDVYAVAVFDAQLLFLKPLEEQLGKHLLTRITGVTGGRTVALTNVDDVPKTIANLSRELRNEYILGYRPSQLRHDGRWREIKVKLKPPKDRAARAFFKRGYRDPN